MKRRDSDRSHACVECFANVELREWIEDNGEPGNCGWCGEGDVTVIALDLLCEPFMNAAEMYVPWDDGEPLAWLLDEDWDVFSEKLRAKGLRRDLVAGILDLDVHPKEDVGDFPDYNGGFKPRRNLLEEIWVVEAEDAVGDYAKGKQPDSGQMDGFFAAAFEDLLCRIPAGTTYHRARIYKNQEQYPFDVESLGAPPPKESCSGRASAAGEPVLYLASDEQTALAEVRAWKGAAVCVAEMELQADALAVDLRQYESPRSPFFRAQIDWWVSLVELIEVLDEEFSTPVLPEDQPYAYVRTQRFCRMAKSHEYNGIVYRSAMGSGHNLVLFDVKAARPVGFKTFRVQDVHYESSQLDEREYPFTETRLQLSELREWHQEQTLGRVALDRLCRIRKDIASTPHIPPEVARGLREVLSQIAGAVEERAEDRAR